MKNSKLWLDRLLRAARSSAVDADEQAPSAFVLRIAARWARQGGDVAWFTLWERSCVRFAVGFVAATVLISLTLWPSWNVFEPEQDKVLIEYIDEIAFRP